MQAETPALEALREKITSYLDQANQHYVPGSDGGYAIRKGTAVVFIRCIESNDHTFVKLVSPLALEITRATSDLAFFLAGQNNNLLVGKLSLDIPSQTIWLEHVLLGDYLQPEELLISLNLVAATADLYDEQIAMAAGGKRAIDVAGG